MQNSNNSLEKENSDMSITSLISNVNKFQREHLQPILVGQPNFRDLGNYQTSFGKKTKTNLVYRSGDFSNLKDIDIQVLNEKALTTIIDFRSEEERVERKSIYPESIENKIYLPLNPGNLSRNKVEQIIYNGDVKATHQLLLDINEMLVLEGQSQYKAFFQQLQNTSNPMPLMFNCTAGKDRTGLAAALFLSALGVQEQDTIEDYLLTNNNLGFTASELKDLFNLQNSNQADALYTLLSVKEDYIQNALRTIRKNYATTESFLVNQLGVDIGKMQELYTV
ncbi:tyrosine-protein phosphatase [Myroides injenensis]|uniref:tyrosine-protein phosphatase n=1 Tax=Myroides injenensis TaxID=1183151 RepID=UPI00028867AE|nr:tyrosine-protein phosphatase [Myroides injenensis]